MKMSIGVDFSLERFTFSLSHRHSAIRRLQRWVATNGALTLTLREAAEVAALEPHYFSATFRRNVGKTFLEWRREYRVSVAVYLIKQGNYTVNQIAAAVGYESRRSLERAIRTYTGETAASFKRDTEEYQEILRRGDANL